MTRITFQNGSYIESIGSSDGAIRGRSSQTIWEVDNEQEETNQMGKIQLGDNMMDVLTKMSAGNPGALTCLLAMVQKKDWHLPNTEPFVYIFQLDELGLYGEKLYMLWNDCCDRDLQVLETVLRNYQMGKLPKEDIVSQVSNGRGRPFEDLVSLEELFPKGE